MKHAYDLMSKAEIAYENEPEDKTKSEHFAMLKTKYALHKKYY